MGLAEEITTIPVPRTDRLLDHYRAIGQALLDYERLSYIFNGGEAKFRSFRQNVAVVPLETLESYLDDLLEQDMSDEILFIRRKGFFSRMESWFLCGATAVLITLLALSLFSLSKILSFGIAGTVFALIFVAASLLVQTRSIMRRMDFAKIVSFEISRRRGGGAGKETWAPNPFRSLFSSQGIPGSAARMIH